jgi:Na+/H+ antiporter NhaD/arsenite permease-like protein
MSRIPSRQGLIRKIQSFPVENTLFALFIPITGFHYDRKRRRDQDDSIKKFCRFLGFFLKRLVFSKGERFLRKATIYVIIILSLSLLSFLIGFSVRQVLALSIFFMVIFGTILFWRFRLPFALLGISLLLTFGLLDVPHLIEFAGLDIILFLVGMMILVGYLEENLFFESLVNTLIRLIGPKPFFLLITLMAAGALSAALVDEVTSILFMTATMIHLTSRFGVNPIPFIIMQVFATNIGSSATVVGNPIGVMIAMRAGLTFMDFLRWASPISLCALLVTIPLSLFYYSNEIRKWKAEMKREGLAEGKSPSQKPKGRQQTVCILLFIGTIAGLILHAQIEKILGLPKNTLLIGTAFMAAGISLLLDRDRARELVENRVDWWTLSFFMMLFATVGTLKYVGTTEIIAKVLLSWVGGNSRILFLVLTWTIGVLTGFMDNVLAVATFIPIIEDIMKTGMDVTPFWWGILFGGTLFGNLTMIGSTANIVAIGIIERQKIGHIAFGQWIIPGTIVSVPTLAVATLLLYLRFY